MCVTYVRATTHIYLSFVCFHVVWPISIKLCEQEPKWYSRHQHCFKKEKKFASERPKNEMCQEYHFERCRHNFKEQQPLE